MLVQSHVDLSYHILYVSDMQRAVKWYYQGFGFQLLSIGRDFVTLQMAPGRLLFLSKNKNPHGHLGLKTGNVKAIASQLVQSGIEFVYPEEDNHTWFELKDPDGNSISVMGGVFGMEDLEFKVPDTFATSPFRLESKKELHLITKKIAGHSEFGTASDELISLCRQSGMTSVGDAFTVSRYTQQVDAIYTSVAVAEAPADPLPDGIEYIQIPRQEYVIHTYNLAFEDFRAGAYAWHHGWMNQCLSKADSMYILEYYDDKYIHSYMPYQWSEN